MKTHYILSFSIINMGQHGKHVFIVAAFAVVVDTIFPAIMLAFIAFACLVRIPDFRYRIVTQFASVLLQSSNN
ncbi:hypothetical protein Ngar_c08530 [Candidatus Nitrososphaera gargensis Ga9.2]|uniref:Uncharacterized protein n=1 Tax=Nitrososphaera gargensis (strain Ga9.2) TaxID=1237085 RepID=K0IDM6_NITGG|nr:hypothetical protein Ngar_c08530 [Candidatus Nitrososphaera gargensis Ga9.2]